MLLFDRLEGSKQQFVLRRSAGFAYSFLSILRAEPRNCPPTLLPYALRRLTELTTSQAEKFHWGVKVHALNVLRLIFADATLADNVMEFSTKAFISAIQGFEDSRWAVRNSSMILFTAVVQRTVDNHKNASSFGQGLVSAQEFFHTHPSLDAYLLKQLERVISLSSQSQLHPLLCPLLLLLSRLNGFTEEEVEGVDAGDKHKGQHQVVKIGQFLELLKGCASQRDGKVRSMAGKALAALAPPEQVMHLLTQLLQALVDHINESTS